MTQSPLRRTTGICALLVLAGLGAAGCSTSADSATGSKGYIAGDGAIRVLPASERPDFPSLSGPTLGGGKDVDTGAFAGSPMVVNVWASWCAPCRAEADDLERAAQRLDDVQFLGINTRDESSAAEAFVRRYDVSYPSLLDEDGSELLEFYGLFNLKALPTTMVVDTEGRIAALVTSNGITETTLVDLVDEVVGGG